MLPPDVLNNDSTATARLFYHDNIYNYFPDDDDDDNASKKLQPGAKFPQHIK